MVQDFCDEDETNDKADKEYMNEFCNLIADQKLESPKHRILDTSWEKGKTYLLCS